MTEIINYQEDDGNEVLCGEDTRLIPNQDERHDLMPMWKAAVNFICDVEGTGLLGLPYAVLNGGVAALAALVIVPVICC